LRSLKLVSQKTLVMDEHEAIEPQPGQETISVVYCALCRTDAKMWAHGHRDLRLPRVLGHEIFGLTKSGAPVLVWPGEACGRCSLCHRGQENLCPEMKILGFNKDGGLAEQINVSQSALIPVPEGLPGRIACLAEPLACCLNALGQTELRSERLLILGAGPVGLLMGLAARARGASVLIVEKNAERLQHSEELRRRLSIAANTGVSDTDFDVCINAASAHETLAQGLDSLRSGGRFCLFSGLSGSDSIPVGKLNEIHYRQLHLSGAYGCTRKQMAQAVAVLNEYKAEAELLLEVEISLEEVGVWLERIAAGRVLKVVVDLTRPIGSAKHL